jgi:hypothetical protein
MAGAVLAGRVVGKGLTTTSGAGKSVSREETNERPISTRRVHRSLSMVQIQIPASSGSTPYHAVSVTAVFPVVYVAASTANTATVYVGPEGAQLQDLQAGDVFPYFDISPADIWAYTTSSSAQTIILTGHGDPEYH